LKVKSVLASNIAPEAKSKASRFLAVSLRFWSGETRVLAWTLTAIVAVFVLAGVYIQAQINVWNGLFFNALERKAGDELMGLLSRFALLVVMAGSVMALTVLTRMALQIKLRESIGRNIVGKWLSDRAYYRLFLRTKGAETPEFRIADDVRLAVDPMVDLTIGFLTSVLLAITFFTVLADVGGTLRVTSLGISIPGYFVIGALLYAVCMSGIASLLGWPLIKSIAAKNHREGQFRYELTRVRQTATTIAQSGDEQRERSVVSQAIDNLVMAWRRVMVAQSQVAGVASANAVLVGVFPVMLAVPKYVTGEMTLGAVMQLATAFIQVQMALNWLVDNFVRFAEWRASANRVGEFVASLEDLDQVKPGAEIAADHAGLGLDALAPAVIPRQP
jgi:putative ATP-binding cassette transporter